MVAIFTGQGSGLQKGSGAVLGAAGLLGNAGLGRSGGNVFVNAANGNLVLEQRDAILVGRGTDIDAGRSYNRSIDLLDRGGITQNWRFNQKRIDATLALDLPGATLKLIDVDGAATTYTWDGAGYVSTDGAGSYDRFTRSLEGWTRTDGGSQVQEKYFDRHLLYGLLTQVVDPSGNTTDYTYTTLGRIARITTADGGYVEYGYDGLDEKVRTVRLGYTDLATGAAKTQTIAYTYAGENLATATIDLSPEDGSTADGAVYTQSYAYNGDGALTSVTETDGSRLDIGYDDMGRVVSLAETVTAGATRTTTLAYAAGATTITDAAGQATTLRYNADGTLASITAPPATAGAPAQTTSFTYNVRGDVESVTDPAGHVTRYTYDDRGNVLTATDRLGNVVRRQWDARNQLIAETRTGADQSSAAAEHTDRYVYDAATRLRFTISATGDVTEQRYNLVRRLHHLRVRGIGALDQHQLHHLARHLDVRPLDRALHQRAGAVLPRFAFVERGALGGTEQAAVDRLQHRAAARHDERDAAEVGRLPGGVGGGHRPVRRDSERARSRRHGDCRAERQPGARRGQRAVLVDRERAAAPQQDLPVGAEQLDEAAAPDGDVHRAPGGVDRPALVRRDRRSRGNAGSREDAVGQHRGHVDVAALRQHRLEAHVGALEGGRVEVGHVVRHDVERALLRPQPDRADMEGAVHRPDCPKVVMARPTRSSHACIARPPASAWRSASMLATIWSPSSTVDASSIPWRSRGAATSSAASIANRLPSIVAGAAPPGAA